MTGACYAKKPYSTILVVVPYALRRVVFNDLQLRTIENVRLVNLANDTCGVFHMEANSFSKCNTVI